MTTGQDALWSAQEVRTQAEQVRGQVTIFDAVGALSLPAEGSRIAWRTWCGETTATVVAYCQGIMEGQGVILRATDGHDMYHGCMPSGWYAL